MADKDKQESKTIRSPVGRYVQNDLPVNQKITLASALKPAKPPKGSKWENRHDPSIKHREKE